MADSDYQYTIKFRRYTDPEFDCLVSMDLFLGKRYKGTTILSISQVLEELEKLKETA